MVKNIALGMDAQISHKELERLVKKNFPDIRIQGWTETGLMINIDVAKLKAEAYQEHTFFTELNNRFVVVKREKWEINIQ